MRTTINSDTPRIDIQCDKNTIRIYVWSKRHDSSGKKRNMCSIMVDEKYPAEVIPLNTLLKKLEKAGLMADHMETEREI